MAEKKELVNVHKAGLDAQQIAVSDRQEILRQQAAKYKYPESPEVLEQLERYQDQKFGLMIHMGLYNLLGMKESWTLVDCFPWTKWQFKPGTTHQEMKEMYDQLHKGFLPLRFDPEEWADMAYDAGFRYLVFTTKHHDGFCMWDTATTDYKVTGSEVPYRNNKNADITKALFDAFRAKGMDISMYYSRADFACPYYWEEGYADKPGTKRVPSYDPEEKPEKWKKFQEFVYAQLDELVTNYGKINSLWYDGGCDGVQLGLPEMTAKLREKQPWMLGVIRGGKGVCEDVITPELFVPDQPILVPWETCTVMGKKMYENGSSHTSFGYTYDQDYMSAKEIAHLLLDVVAKGGNLALNLAPQPDGRLPLRAVAILKEFSKWMHIFQDAIHCTRAVAPYRVKNWAFTQSKDCSKVNAFYLYTDRESVAPKIVIPYTEKITKVTDMRSGKVLEFKAVEGGIEVTNDPNAVGFMGDIADCYIME